MKLTYLDHEIFQTEYLVSLQDANELKRACLSAVEQGRDLEQLIQIHAEIVLLTIRLREVRIDPCIYSFMPMLLGDLRLKIEVEKLNCSAQ